MDMKNLVEKITRDVMETLKEKERLEENPSISSIKINVPKESLSGKKAILIMDMNYSSFEWMNFLSEDLKDWDISIFTCSSVKLPDDFILRSGVTNIIQYRDGISLASQFQGFSFLIYRAVQPYQLTQLINLMDNNLAVRAIIEALSKGIHVIVVDSIERTGSLWERKLEEYVRELCQMGISVERLKDKQDVLSNKCSNVDCGECAGCGLCATLIPQKVEIVREAGADRISSAPGVKGLHREIGAMIDHTLLKPDATREQIIKLCEEAKEYEFASVCINPAFVKLASECLRGSPVKVCTVIGFPLGATTSVTKAIETRDAIANGADEIDMVINVGALKAGNHELVQKDIEAVVEAACGRIVKVILETALLTDEEKVMACKLSKMAGADFVKTSTGFGPGGATAQDVSLMRQTVGKYMGVKASGGIRDLETARKMIEAGATRIGASASVAIVKGEKGESKY